MALLLNAGDTVSRSYSYTQPSPLHPSQPQGTGERTGNLFDGSIEQGTINENSSIGTSYNNTKSIPAAVINLYRVRTANPIYIDRELTLSVDFNSYQMYVLFYDENQQYTGEHSSSWRNSSLTLSGKYIGKHIGLVVKSKASGNVPISPTDDIKLMLNVGSTALPYEPYGYKLDISCGDTVTPIYLGEVETTRKIKKYIFDGTEQWQRTANGAYYLASSVTPITDFWHDLSITSVNSHFAAQENVIGSSGVADNKSAFYGGSTQATKEYYIAARDIADTTDFKSYLAAQYANGTPVTVWYVLANEETAVVNEPLMRIGNYADEVSNVSIPVTAGGDTLSVDTTVQPSEVTVNYKGWHPVADVHEYEGGWN